MENNIYYLHAMTGLHVGTGQGCGVIDLPIAREQASNLPIVPGSGIKGVLRYELKPQLDNDDDYLALFGPETDKADEHAGALCVGDAKLLCLPVRSFCGTFAWATCPMVLHRYRRDLFAETEGDKLPAIPALQKEQTAYHSTETVLADDKKVYLEDLDLECKPNNDVTQWAKEISNAFFKGDTDWQALFQQRFIVLPDSVFDFLAETATEIRARIKIEEGSRTVQKGGLWYEENLPAESLLWGVVATDKSRKKGVNKDDKEMLSLLPQSLRLQIGGNATVGAGQVRWLLATGE